MPNDLSKPLGIRNMKKGLWARLPLGLVGATILAATVVGASAWIVIVRDPLGGEPIASVRIDRTKTGLGPKDVAVADLRKPADTRANAGAGDEDGDPQSQMPESPTEPEKPKRPPAVQIAEGQPLTTAAVPKVSEKGKYGILPKLATDGTRPIEQYARPASPHSATSARVVVIVGGLGLSQTGTQEAIRLLPPAVTLGFAPYGASLDRWMQRARQEGHELLVQVPMEPFDYPDNDPGPQTLLTSLSPDQNLDRLHWVMSRLTNYVGVINYTGAKFTASTEQLTPVMQDLASRGVMFVDDGSSSRSIAEGVADTAHAPFVKADMTIDTTTTEAAIDARLAQLENLARSRGTAIGTASALPLSVRRIVEWSKGLQARGVLLVPVTASLKQGQM
jgi:polysaccharide deacetylase 2 family uncharacterized protein YibQ